MRVGFSTIYAGAAFEFGYRKPQVKIGTEWAIFSPLYEWQFFGCIRWQPYKQILANFNVLYTFSTVILQCHSWLSKLTEGTQHGFFLMNRAASRCDYSRDSVMYGSVTQTSTTEVSRLPRTVDTTCSSSVVGAPGNEASESKCIKQTVC